MPADRQDAGAPRRRHAASLLAVVAALLAACGSGGSPSTPAATAADRHITVFAASSLTDAFAEGGDALSGSGGPDASFSFAGSQQLVNAIRQGAPADVVATADGGTMTVLTQAGLVEDPVTVAHNTLEIAVAPGNPHHVTGLADLASPALQVVLADRTVPAGRAAHAVLDRAHVTVVPRSNELDVRAALQKVENGDADAAIVYVTDVAAAGARVAGVPIPSSQNEVVFDRIAIVRRTLNHAAAADFVTSAVSGEVHRALLRRGFLPA